MNSSYDFDVERCKKPSVVNQLDQEFKPVSFPIY